MDDEEITVGGVFSVSLFVTTTPASSNEHIELNTRMSIHYEGSTMQYLLCFYDTFLFHTSRTCPIIMLRRQMNDRSLTVHIEASWYVNGCVTTWQTATGCLRIHWTVVTSSTWFRQ
jgi:hypothetical protein